MSSSSRPAWVIAAVTAVLLSLTLTAPSTAVDGDRPGDRAASPSGDSSGDSYRDNFRTPRADGPLDGTEFKGIDGKMYKPAPLLVNGKKGTRYYGEEFNAACGYGAKFTRSLERLRSIAALIERSGRRVVFTVGPNKSAVNIGDLKTNRLPHGRCDKLGMKQQNDLLDRYKDPRYLPMRAPLAKVAASTPNGRDLFWPIDTHWTSLATSRYAVALANRLSPKVGALQTFRRGTETIETDISTIGLYPENYETGPALFSTTKVKVSPPQSDDPFDWKTKPASKTIHGHTLLLGDSFTYRGLGNLRPLFHHGKFLWIAEGGMDAIAEAIPRADTVVIEIVQRWLPISPLVRPAFKKQIKHELARYDAS